jgi:hypothetical protein
MANMASGCSFSSAGNAVDFECGPNGTFVLVVHDYMNNRSNVRYDGTLGSGTTFSGVSVSGSSVSGSFDGTTILFTEILGSCIVIWSAVKTPGPVRRMTPTTPGRPGHR